jgi:aspartate carbamoyltransferase regulatory subunit
MNDSEPTRELKITPIRNGTVIDHIPDGLALEVLRIVGGRELNRESTVSIAMHVRSAKNGWKDILKVENMELSPRTSNAIALVAPAATISIIRDYSVREKHTASLPNRIDGILRCPNLECITNQGEPIETSFEVAHRRPIRLRCRYCDEPVTEFLPQLP